MGVKVSLDRIACNTSTGDQAITVDAGGLIPEIALFYVVKATVNGAPSSNGMFCHGAATATDERWCIGHYLRNGDSSSDTRQWYQTTRVVYLRDYTGTIVAEADIVSFGANTVTINWSNAPPAAYLMTVVTLSGTDVSAYAGFKSMDALENVEQDITDPGFEPDILLPWMASNRGTPGSSNDFESTWAFVRNNGDGSETQLCCMFNSDDGYISAKPSGQLYNTEYAAARRLGQLGQSDRHYDVDNFDSDGFSVYPRDDNGAGYDFLYVALAFNGAVQTWVGTHTTPTTPQEKSETAIGFKPQFMMTYNTTMDLVNTARWGWRAGAQGWSFVTADKQYSMSTCDEDDAGVMNTQSLSEDKALNLPMDDGTTGEEADFVEFLSNGFKYDYTDVIAQSSPMFIMAIEEGPIDEYSSPFPPFRRAE